MDFGGGQDIRFERAGRAGLVTLTRPKALNALTHDMVKALSRALTEWAADPAIALVVIRGEGRAFSAGGDLMLVYQSRDSGNPPVDFFADEYRLNAQIERFPKPYVALIDGIVMGGGVGVSFHGSHRVMTENAVFAMPEVGIGFFPDVGASHLLPDLGGSFGMYLALTGARIGYGDALWSGLATHTMEAQYLGGLLDQICDTGDPDGSLRGVFRQARRETDGHSLAAISRHFSRPSLRDVVRSLETDARSNEFAAKTLAAMRKRSPTSLAVAFKSILSGQTRSMAECMGMEFRIVNRMLAGHDFYEGIRTVIVDKGDTPRWRPGSVAAVTGAEVDAYFAPLPGGDLTL